MSKEAASFSTVEGRRRALHMPSRGRWRINQLEGAATKEIRADLKVSLYQGKNAVFSKSPTESALSQKYTQKITTIM